MKELELRIFRFDKDKDYEAYYKPYVYTSYENFTTLFDLLLQICYDDIYFDFLKDENSYVFVNKKLFRLDTSLSEILNTQGFELVISPLSEKRAIKDLIIDKSDFLAQFTYFKGLDSCDKKFYESLDHLYYSSEVLEFLPQYFGDSFFYFVAKMIEKYPKRKREFLDLISDKEKGIFYHLKTQNEDLERSILALKKELFEQNLLDENAFITKQIEVKNPHFPRVKHDFKDFNIAIYGFELSKEFKNKLQARFVNYENASKNNGFVFLKQDPHLAYKMAASILLDAYDSGADFLLVDDEDDFYIFDTCAKNLMKQSNREFEDFYILRLEELLALIQGEKPQSLKEHRLRVTLV